MSSARFTVVAAAGMAVAVLAGLGGCSSGATGNAVRNGTRALTEFAVEAGGAARGSADDLAAGIRTQVDDLLDDGAVVAARNDEVTAIRSTSDGDEAYRAMCNITVDFAYPSVEDAATLPTDEVSGAAVKLLSAAQGELPNGAMTAWSERIQNLGAAAFGEPDEQEIARLKLARDSAVYAFQLAYCG